MNSSEQMLVTGGAGFIGSHLVEALLRERFPVRVVDNLSTGHRSNLSHSRDATTGSRATLRTSTCVGGRFEGVACVFHQAAIPSVPRSVREPLSSHASGPTATLNLLEAARQAGVQRFVFAASSSAYGETTELPNMRTCCHNRSALTPRANSPVKPTFRLRAHDGAGRSKPSLFQYLRAPARPIEPLQRRDLPILQSRCPKVYDRPFSATGPRRATSLMWPMPWPPTLPRFDIHGRSEGLSTTSGPAGESVCLTWLHPLT